MSVAVHNSSLWWSQNIILGCSSLFQLLNMFHLLTKKVSFLVFNIWNMERYPLVWNSHFYLVSSLVSYPSDPDPAAVYPLTLAPARLHVHAICCILKAKPAALHGSVLSAEPCLSIHCLMASANCPTQTTLAFAVLWLDTVQIPRPPLLQLLPLARRMPFIFLVS